MTQKKKKVHLLKSLEKMKMNRSTNKFHRDFKHPTKKEINTMNRTIAGLQSELKMFYNRHEEIVKMLGHINNEIRLLEEELMKLTTDQPVMNSFDSAESAAQMLGIAKDKTDASDSS